MQEEQIYNLLAKHFSGEATPDEEKIINVWLQENPLNKGQYDEMKSLWNVTVSNNSDWNVDAAWKNLSAKTNIELKSINMSSFTNRIFNTRNRYTNIAAVFLVIFCGYFLMNQFGVFNRNDKDNIVWVEKVTALGEKAEIFLPDNSKIILNGSSKLKYPKQFDGDKREVELEGEAYFEVTHKPDFPFIVHAGNISTTVLGTKFNVSAFTNENNIAVSLIEGKVKVSRKESKELQPIIILQPNQQFIYNREAKISSVEQFDTDKTIGWKDNILIFDNESLVQVLARLERAYGTKFELAANSFKDFKVTANFKKEYCLTVIEVLQKLTGLEASTTKENDEIIKIVFEEK